MAETEIKKINGRTLADETAREMAKNVEGAVKYTEQTLTDSQKQQARENIGAGTSSFSGSYNDLTNKPTIPTAVTVDSALSDSSVNPVQNKVVTSFLATKAEKVAVTTSDNGKFLRVVNGVWAAASIDNANGVSF